MLTVRNLILGYVRDVAGTRTAFEEIEQRVSNFTESQLVEAMLECGVIPEEFDHDSSEEKLWAKCCDILLSLALARLGLESRVIRLRGDSADVLATGQGYTLVGDAKAFRLSRTAKNQKDFKIAALDDWRRENTYACLAGPLTQFPKKQSQIYKQAVRMNVTLVSYTHLCFLLQYPIIGPLENLWKVGVDLQHTGSAQEYWAAVDSSVMSISSAQSQALDEMKRLELEKIRELGAEGIAFWENRIEH